MQEISVLVILLLIVYTVIAVTDQISIQCGIYTPLFAATFTAVSYTHLDVYKRQVLDRLGLAG